MERDSARLSVSHSKFQLLLFPFLLRTYTSERLQRLHRDYLHIPAEHQKMLPSFPATIDRIQKAIDRNYEFVRAIVSTAVGMFEDSAVSQFVSLSDQLCSAHFDTFNFILISLQFFTSQPFSTSYASTHLPALLPSVYIPHCTL